MAGEGQGKGVFNFDKIEDWANLRARAIDAFDGELPNGTTEQLVIDAYEQHPAAVKKAIAQVATDFTKGTIRSGWGVTKNRAERILAPPSNPSAKTGIDREKAIARAEQWIKTTGCHYDRQTEILQELFSDRGLFRAYAQIDLIEVDRPEGHQSGQYPTNGQNTPDLTMPKWKLSEPTGDTALVERMTKLWDQARPTGIAIEDDANARAEKFKRQQAELRVALATLNAHDEISDYPFAPLPDVDYSADPDSQANDEIQF